MPDHLEIATSIADALDGDTMQWNVPRGMRLEYPWYGTMLGELVGIVGEAEIKYLSSKFQDADEGVMGIIAIFTSEALITTTITKAADRSVTVTTNAISRSRLEAIEAHGAFDLLGSSNSGPRWPGRYQVALTYANADSLGLPLGLQHWERSEKLVAFLPALLSDLAK